MSVNSNDFLSFCNKLISPSAFIILVLRDDATVLVSEFEAIYSEPSFHRYDRDLSVDIQFDLAFVLAPTSPESRRLHSISQSDLHTAHEIAMVPVLYLLDTDLLFFKHVPHILVSWPLKIYSIITVGFFQLWQLCHLEIFCSKNSLQS